MSKSSIGTKLICDTLSGGLAMIGDEEKSLELRLSEWESFVAYWQDHKTHKHYWFSKTDQWIVVSGINNKVMSITAHKVMQTLKSRKGRTITLQVNSEPITFDIITTITNELVTKNNHYWLNIKGNATSILYGSNTNSHNMIYSSLDELIKLFSTPFYTMLRILNYDCPRITEALINGEPSLHNIQFAASLKTSDKDTLLSIYSNAYGLIDRKAHTHKRYNIARELDLIFNEYNDDQGYKTGFFIQAKSGEKPLFSFNMYDKVKEGQFTGLIKYWEKSDITYYKEHIRLDFTLFRRFFEKICTEAFGSRKEYTFNIKNLSQAIINIDEKQGFSLWLTKEILLDRIALFSVWSILDPKRDVIHELEELFKEHKLDKVLESWKACPSTSLKETIRKHLKDRTATSKNRSIQNAIEEDLNLSLHMTYNYINTLQLQEIFTGANAENKRDIVEKFKTDQTLSNKDIKSHSLVAEVFDKEYPMIQEYIKKLRQDKDILNTYEHKKRFKLIGNRKVVYEFDTQESKFIRG